ncbi:Ribonuclease H-like superfamily [Arabidopsis thaliana x Arabidopsis arenosa]|uniref:Ribonuclease H-like superfamily n=1 Tax=Arabidopsis thaliana x Arabidopsis arenosa TaxID=1240361 RepID=A0A8T2ATS6_9BRAS|nr:Ribonuclease H-like superfamily [Arabidopsis thaliana x Arabidopsis arenosa]
MAGRVTLTRSVLASIPVHSMSTIALPSSIIKSLDKVARDFVWGSHTGQRKQHLLAWKRVCRPRLEGGLGIRSAKAMNKALLSKVGWRLLRDKDSLWAKVLRSKYKVGEPHDKSWTVAKGHWSSTWRSICSSLREVVLPNIGWVLGDGLKIQFWTDKWLGQMSIIEFVTKEVPAELLAAKVRDLWRNDRGWDLVQIMPYISETTRYMLSAVVVDAVTGARDRLSWRDSPDGNFTVKAAYSVLTRDETAGQDSGKLFHRVWRALVPERVRIFFWLVVNQAVMTNVERKRRHLCDTDLCQICKSGEETILHILRDCPAMAGIWTRLLPPRRLHVFFSQSLLEWIYSNLGEQELIGGSPWSTTFALEAWWGWKWRCGNIFGENRKCRDRVRFIKDLAKEAVEAHSVAGNRSRTATRVERQIAWVPPREGWLKLNTDGASRGNPGRAAAGGVLRDSNGTWCGGFAVNIGLCSAPLAELWGVYYGLFIAWERRATRVELEVDSQLRLFLRMLVVLHAHETFRYLSSFGFRLGICRSLLVLTPAKVAFSASSAGFGSGKGGFLCIFGWLWLRRRWLSLHLRLALTPANSASSAILFGYASGEAQLQQLWELLVVRRFSGIARLIQRGWLALSPVFSSPSHQASSIGFGFGILV